MPFALFLLEEGASPNISTRKGDTVLHAAISIGGRNIGFDPDAVLKEPKNKLTLITALLAHGANPNARAERVSLRTYTGAGIGVGPKDADNFGVARRHPPVGCTRDRQRALDAPAAGGRCRAQLDNG